MSRREGFYWVSIRGREPVVAFWQSYEADEEPTRNGQWQAIGYIDYSLQFEDVAVLSERLEPPSAVIEVTV